MIAIILYGLPGAGKGTQAKLLSKKYGYLHISTGDIIRDVINNKRDGYKELEKFLKAGLLIPDEIVVDMVIETLKINKDKNAIILDGFPRTLKQLRLFEEHLKRESINSVKILNILIEVSEENLRKRILGRRICKSCGAIYNIYVEGEISKCIKCGDELIQRDDDKEEVLNKRLEEFYRQTKPLIDYLEKNNRLLKIDGNVKDIELINKNIENLIEKYL